MNINNITRSALYKGRYIVFENGDIYNLKNHKLKPGTDGRGYKYIFVHDGKSRKTEKVHRIVAKCFIPNPDNKPQINHVDGDKSNNDISNLEWVTQSENMKHAFSLGLCENTLRAARKNGSEHGKETILHAIEATRKPVINKSSGIVYPSVKAASDAIGVKYDTLRSWLNGVNRNKSSLEYIKYEY